MFSKNIFFNQLLGMKNINDEERFIFARMAEGDKEAFRFFFEKYYADLCNFVNIYLNDPAMAEDIVQDVCVCVFLVPKRRNPY